MNATVSINLAEFDQIRDRAEKYKEVNQGLAGFVEYLKEQDAEAEKSTDKKKKKSLLPASIFVDSIKAYNNTNPDHPFTV